MCKRYIFLQSLLKYYIWAAQYSQIIAPRFNQAVDVLHDNKDTQPINTIKLCFVTYLRCLWTSLRGRGETENKKAQGWGHLASQVLFCCDAGVKMKYGGVP